MFGLLSHHRIFPTTPAVPGVFPALKHSSLRMDAAGFNLKSLINQNQEDDMIRVYNDLEALSPAAAEIFTLQSRQASLICGRFSVALSGGGTPRRLYEILATSPFRERIHWNEVHVFWSDERCVPEDDPRNNARMARLTLLNLVPIPPSNIHPIRSDQSPQQAAD